MIGGHRTVKRHRGVALATLVTCAVALLVPTAAAEEPSSQPAEATAKGRVAASNRPWNAFETRWVSGRLFGGLALDTVRYIQEEGSEEQLGDLTDYEKPEVRVARLGLAGTINFSKPWGYYISGAYLGFGRGFDLDCQFRRTRPASRSACRH